MFVAVLASSKASLVELDNVRDHRSGASDHLFSKDAQDRLRVHHIAITRLPLSCLPLNPFKTHGELAFRTSDFFGFENP